MTGRSLNSRLVSCLLRFTPYVPSPSAIPPTHPHLNHPAAPCTGGWMWALDSQPLQRHGRRRYRRLRADVRLFPTTSSPKTPQSTTSDAFIDLRPPPHTLPYPRTRNLHGLLEPSSKHQRHAARTSISPSIACLTEPDIVSTQYGYCKKVSSTPIN